MANNQIHNPILPGFYPDPSICRKGDDYYIACSSFSYFPGVPLFHSRDLCHWEPIGYALDRPDQLKLTPNGSGLFAPTLRYHDGLFYLIVGNTTTGEVLLATAEDPAGAWSEVHDIQVPGGDPSLFWDDDGSCWVSYNFMNKGIYHQQLDLTTYEIISDPIYLWNGAAIDAWFPEASHMYKKDGWYYLMLAEGGTEHHHAVTIARSRNIHGPYTSFRGNPILTHRHLGMYYPICNIGHADIVDTPAGEWYMVALGSRIYGGYHKNLGRETYLAPMIWEGDWPVVSPGTGKVEFTYPAPALQEFPMTGFSNFDHFNGTELDGQWNYLGTPENKPARLSGSNLYIKTLAEPIGKVKKTGPMFFGDMANLDDLTGPDAMNKVREMLSKRRDVDLTALSFVARRQTDINYTATAKMNFSIKADCETAGIVLFHSQHNQICLEMALDSGNQVIRVVRYRDSTPSDNMGDILPVFPVEEAHDRVVLGQISYQSNQVILRIQATQQSNSFFAGESIDSLIPVATNVDGGFLGAETTGSFTGAYLGMYASGNGRDTGNEAAFDWFEYLGND